MAMRATAMAMAMAMAMVMVMALPAMAMAMAMAMATTARGEIPATAMVIWAAPLATVAGQTAQAE
jgi:hypothetical protein